MKKRGFSLLETLVAMVCMAMVMNILYSLLLPGLRVWLNSRNRSELQQDGVVSIRWLTVDFSTSTTDSANVVSQTYVDPLTNGSEECDIFTFMSPYDKNGLVSFTDPIAKPPGGDLEYQKQILYFINTTNNTFCRQEQYLPSPVTNPAPLTSPVIDQNLPIRVIAKNALSFTVAPNFISSPDPTSSWKRMVNPVQFSLMFRLNSLSASYSTGTSVLAQFTTN